MILNKQIKQLANQLPTDLCKVAPIMLLNEKSIVMLQQGITLSANLIEKVHTIIELLTEEVQNLRDEVAEFKGEQGKPEIRPQTKSKDDNDNGNDDDSSNNNQSNNISGDNNELDERIAKTKSQKEQLLVALNHPETPLHNNSAELGAIAQARRRDISYKTRNQRGTEAKDTFMSIISTAQQLGISAINYIKDRISGIMELTPLTQIIEDMAKETSMARIKVFCDNSAVNST